MTECENCKGISSCPICGGNISAFDHVGVRGTVSSVKIPIVDYTLNYDSQRSGIWHYAKPCGHRITARQGTANLKYNGGPLWQDGYTWINIYWGTYFSGSGVSDWIRRVDNATVDIERDTSYSGGLKQYNVGMGRLIGHAVMSEEPASTISDPDIAAKLKDWIKSGKVTDVGQKGAYNIFLPPGVTALLSNERSCAVFCDYHNSANGNTGPFYTVEPYPCSQGCNQCTSNPFDTLTTGLSEEMVELKTDMNPGTGWVIGNEEICDYCDTNYVCKQISTGEYVNSWYDRSTSSCWSPK